MDENTTPTQTQSSVPEARVAESAPKKADGVSMPAGETTQQEQTRHGVTSWFNGLFGRGKPDQDVSRDEEASKGGEQPTANTDPLGKLVSELEALSEDDLRELPRKSTKAAKLIQSETDRREARRRAEEAAKNPADAATLQRITELEGQERTVRQTDPYRAAELRDEADRLKGTLQAAQQWNQQTLGLVRSTVETYDQHTLNPMLELVPEAARGAVFSDLPQDLSLLEQRQEVVKRALKALERSWREDEAKKVRGQLARNPSLRKQVVLGEREEEDEPDLTPAPSNGHAGRTDMDTLLRGMLGQPSRSRRR